jgi:ribosome-binding factor A
MSEAWFLVICLTEYVKNLEARKAPRLDFIKSSGLEAGTRVDRMRKEVDLDVRRRGSCG